MAKYFNFISFPILSFCILAGCAKPTTITLQKASSADDVLSSQYQIREISGALGSGIVACIFSIYLNCRLQSRPSSVWFEGLAHSEMMFSA